MKTIVWCTFQVPGFHRWPKAPQIVKHLRAEHRHIFHFKVGVEVTHDNRDVEFQTLRADAFARLRKLTDYDAKDPLEIDALMFGNKSCEMIAKELAKALEQDTSCITANSYKAYAIEVSEDGENGAIVYFD